MDLLQTIQINLLSPIVLAFVLGIIAVVVKSNLSIPEQVYSIISIYLLFAIGLKGGFDLAKSSLDGFLGAGLVAVLIGTFVPIWSWWILRRFGKMDDANAIAIAIHYGGVSAVTLSACVTFLQEIGVTPEGFMPSMYVIMELPAVIVGLMLANALLGQSGKVPTGELLKSALSGKSFLLLGGGVVIGYLSGETGAKQVAPFYVTLFPGFLTLFLLEMGTLVGQRLADIRKMGSFLIVFGMVMPLINGAIGVALSALVGLSLGGAMMMGVMAASASYITAPAVVQANIPQANAGYYLTSSLVITFPFNLIIGMPLYFELAKRLTSG